MTQLDSTTETIDGHKFEVYKLDPLKSLEALSVVKEAVAPALGTALGSIESLGELTDIIDSPEGGQKLGGALERLLMGITNKRIKFLIETFSPVTEVDGQNLTGDRFKLIFRGDLPLMFSWLKLCFRGEWGNVWGALRDGIKSAIAQAEPTEKSPST